MNTDVVTRLPTDGLVLAQATSGVSTDKLAGMGRQTRGLVLSDKPGIGKARALRAAGFSRPLVLDLLNVDGRDTVEAQGVRHRVWQEGQVEGSSEVLVTPSRRVRAGDERALQAQLDEARGLLSDLPEHGAPEGMVGLALEAAWLSASADLEKLLGRLDAAVRPVALAFAHPFDPICSQGHVRGLRALGQSDADIAVLRSDLAGIGAWAHGARFASVGLSSTVRHLPVPMTNRATRETDPTPHVLVHGCWAWTKASKLHFIGEHPRLRCACAVCGGQALARLGDGLDIRHDEAQAHSLQVWAELVDDLLGAPYSERSVAWHRICKRAQEVEEELAEDLEIQLKWRPLSHWVWL